jgi:hypothetical protein
MNTYVFSSGSFQSAAKLVLLVALFFAFPGYSASPTTARGFVIYVAPPGSYIDVLEYSSLAKVDGVVTRHVSSKDGQTRLLKNVGIRALVPYPGGSADGAATQDPSVMLREIETLRGQYPDAAGKLSLAREKWTEAGKIAEADREKARKAAASIVAMGLKLVVAGRTYENSTLASADGSSAAVNYVDGIAHIPLEALTKEQILALNATSTTARIDPNWKQKRTEAEAKKKQEEITAKNAAPGDHNIASAASSRLPEHSRQVGSADASLAREEFGTPPPPLREVEPSVDETVEFINAKFDAQAAAGEQKFRLGYIRSIGKWAIRGTLDGSLLQAVTFSFADLNPDKIILNRGKHDNGFGRLVEDDSLALHCTNDAKRVEIVWFNGASPFHQQGSKVGIPCKDQFDMEKMGKAFLNLIHAYGGKGEAF